MTIFFLAQRKTALESRRAAHVLDDVSIEVRVCHYFLTTSSLECALAAVWTLQLFQRELSPQWYAG